MKTIINIKENKFWKIYSNQKCKLWLKGYFNTHLPLEVMNGLNEIEFSKIDDFIKSLKGRYALVFKNKSYCILLVDRIRSTPMHFSIINKVLHISDLSNEIIRKKFFENDINSQAVKEISMSGFVIGSKSVYSNLITPLAGEYYIFSNKKVIKRSYFSYFGKISNNNYSDLISELESITVSIFEKLLKKVGQRQIVIPLSAGNDSRLVVSILKYLGAKNVKCYSYGQKNNFESKVSKEIAKKLDYDWIFIPLTHLSEKIFYNSIEYKNFLEYADNHSAIPFIQSISTFNYLKKEKYINKDSVFINGNSGDFISGGHINNLYKKIKKLKNKKTLKKVILNELVHKHFSLWGFLKNKENLRYLRNELWDSITKKCDKLNINNAHLFYEYSEFIDRQSKYVVSGQRVYEFHNFDWELPLWDDKYLFFWKKVPAKYKFKQKLYLDMLKKNNFGGVWTNDFPINNKEIRPIWLIPIRFLFKIPFAFFGNSGRRLWHQFDVNVFQYWIDPTLIICSTSYLEILKDFFKKPRNAISWLSKKYVKNYGN